ncbi:unnamed protein product [Porites evermanni]|uniref:Coiled-coil-helix-coiled-coil-helix domain-containing protein 7 n=1 Tax=Porites evermanni TaxID=104178 RepID=A0ABN8M783_9CNID|nr:unnamed protein product [Porites evermanni]
MADGLKRYTDQRTNPCIAESQASMKCLDENNYDKTKCKMYFEAYKECKKAWNERKAVRRRQGLPPNDPAACGLASGIEPATSHSAGFVTSSLRDVQQITLVCREPCPIILPLWSLAETLM